MGNETEIIEEQNLIKSSQSDEYENSSADNEKVKSLKTTCKIEEESHIVSSEDNRNVILESVTTQILHNTEEEQSSKIKKDLTINKTVTSSEQMEESSENLEK